LKTPIEKEWEKFSVVASFFFEDAMSFKALGKALKIYQGLFEKVRFNSILKL